MDSSGMMARISELARSSRLKPTESMPLVLVIPQRQRNLQVFVGVQACGVLEMAVAQSAGVAQQGDHLVLSGNQMHRRISL